MIKQYAVIFFSFILIVGQQHAMFTRTQVLLKKYKDCPHFTQRFLKILHKKNQSALHRAQLISQVPLEEELMNTLLEQKKVFKTDVILFVSRMVSLNQAKSLQALKNACIDIQYIPDDFVKYQIQQDDAGNIIDTKVSKESKVLLDQVALLSYNDTRVLVYSSNYSHPIIDKKKLLNSRNYQEVEYFFNEVELGFEELKAESKN